MENLTHAHPYSLLFIHFLGGHFAGTCHRCVMGQFFDSCCGCKWPAGPGLSQEFMASLDGTCIVYRFEDVWQILINEHRSNSW